MSANYVVDLYGTCFMQYTLVSTALFPASGAIIGEVVDLNEANSFTNLLVVGRPVAAGISGQLRIQVQTADTILSGDFTDPTSGLAAFPTVFESGGIVRLNSGGLGEGLFGAGVSGQFIRSGFVVTAAFQRPHRYARANVISGDFFFGLYHSSFVAQRKTTGSGGGSWGTSGFITSTQV